MNNLQQQLNNSPSVAKKAIVLLKEINSIVSNMKGTLDTSNFSSSESITSLAKDVHSKLSPHFQAEIRVEYVAMMLIRNKKKLINKPKKKLFGRK